MRESILFLLDKLRNKSYNIKIDKKQILQSWRYKKDETII